MLAGRDTPSPGLEVAAEYIAAQFRRARLAPAVGGGYFQTARFLKVNPTPETFDFRLDSPRGSVTVTKEDVAAPGPAGFAVASRAAVKAGAAEAAGNVIIAEGRLSPARLRQLAAGKPALIVALDRTGRLVRDLRSGVRLAALDGAHGVPWIALHNDALAKAVDAGLEDARITARLRPAAPEIVTLRNVIGVLPGSDPALQGTYVLVTAHYDHIGVKPGCKAGDCIFNGANDNASGAASLIEIASALARHQPRPKRTIVFMALFGEEKGGYGARHYTRHPVFPLAQTVANVNLEQLGRTEAPGLNTATLTGFGYSDVPRVFSEAGMMTGVKVENSPDSNDYFGRSDNLVFAEAGIPAHTLCVAYTFPDYHAVDDSWEKINYPNLARVNRMIALGVLMLAENPNAPRWNEAEPGARPYLKAWQQRRAE